MNTSEMMERRLKEQDIATRALHRWEMAGHHHRRDLEYWLQAEAELGSALPTIQAGEPASNSCLERPSLECIEAVLLPAQ